MCYNCLEYYDAHKNECPRCGYLYDTPHNPTYIAPGTILHDRYIVGVLIGYNGEGANYTAYDKNMGCKVLIREYMPATLCTRVKNKPVISVNYNNLAKYKAFMAEFTELNKSLARFRNNTNIIPTIDMFAENNTTYTVSEYVEGIKLLDYIKDNAGELSWEKVRKIFPPLFTTIGIIHNAGIIHRAISPETIYVTENGELKLSGFCVSSVRTADAGLEYELFKGYSAPEQYSASTSSRQGSWTDVYGVSALLYRVLTGCMPLDAASRLQDDTLCEPSVLNKNIPQHVSRVIMEGLNLSGRDRIQTITELVTKLFDEPEEVKPVYPKTPVHNEDMLHTTQISYAKPQQTSNNNNNHHNQYHQPQHQNGNQHNNRNNSYYDDNDYEYESVSTIDRFKTPVIIGVLLLAILLIAIVAFINVMGGNEDQDSSNSFISSSVPDNVIPGTTEETTELFDSTMLDLKGKFFDITQQKYSESFTLEKTEEYNDDYEKGQIFEQDLAPGAPFKKGETIVKVKVSKGPAEAVIPDYKGYTVTQYESMLTEAGVPYQLVEDTSGNGTANSITRIEVRGEKTSPGNKVNISSGEKLMVYFVIKDATTTTTTTTTVTTTEAVTTPVVTTTTTAPPPPTEPPTEAPTEPPQNNEQPVAPPPENNVEENNNNEQQ